MNPWCANERDFHQLFIRSAHRLPAALRARPDSHVLVWGHEVRLLEAGRGGGDGAADLLAADDAGTVWLIEAKFGYNPELCGAVWDGQLARYRTAIGRMSWQRVLAYCEAFLNGAEATQPGFVVPPQTASFVEVLDLWRHRTGGPVFCPDELNRRIAEALAAGTYGIMVLADSYAPDVVEAGNRFSHNGPLAYVQRVPSEQGLDLHLRWHRPPGRPGAGVPVAVDAESDFGLWTREVNRKCHPGTFADTLHPAVRDLWVDVLRPGLAALGWDGTSRDVKQRAFNVACELRGVPVPLLVVGWSEADAAAVCREHKLAGRSSIKVNPRMRALLGASGSIDFVNRWAARFHRLGWRGRPSQGMRDRWGVVPMTAGELQSVEGVMLYNPSADVRDHTGRPGDRESLTEFVQAFGQMLAELRSAGIAFSDGRRGIGPTRATRSASRAPVSRAASVVANRAGAGRTPPRTATASRHPRKQPGNLVAPGPRISPVRPRTSGPTSSRLISSTAPSGRVLGASGRPADCSRGRS